MSHSSLPHLSRPNSTSQACRVCDCPAYQSGVIFSKCRACDHQKSNHGLEPQSKKHSHSLTKTSSSSSSSSVSSSSSSSPTTSVTSSATSPSTSATSSTANPAASSKDREWHVLI
eukprot:g79540.t1